MSRLWVRKVSVAHPDLWDFWDQPRSRSFVSTVSPQTNSWRGVDGRVELWRFRSENGNPTWFLVESSVSTWSKHDPLCHQMNWHSIVGLLFLYWIIGRHHRIITKRNPQSLTERNIKMIFFFLWFSGFQKCMPLPKKQCFVSNIINHRLKKWLETWLRFILRFFSITDRPSPLLSERPTGNSTRGQQLRGVCTTKCGSFLAEVEGSFNARWATRAYDPYPYHVWHIYRLHEWLIFRVYNR